MCLHAKVRSEAQRLEVILSIGVQSQLPFDRSTDRCEFLGEETFLGGNMLRVTAENVE